MGASIFLFPPPSTSNVVCSFHRDPDTGGLVFRKVEIENILPGPLNPQLTISRDGKNIYVAELARNTVTALQRNSATGALTLAQTIIPDAVPEVVDQMRSIAISADGARVYVARQSLFSTGALLVLARDAITGSLSFAEGQYDGVAGVHELEQPAGVVESGDGAHVYVASGELSSAGSASVLRFGIVR